MTKTNHAVAATITAAQVRESIAAAREHGARFFDQIVWQVENETWTVLGYGSWDEMREAEYADLGVVAPRADRPELVARLRARGLTNQQVADTIGTSEPTVRRLTQSSNDDSLPRTITDSRGLATVSRQLADASSEPAEPVTGSRGPEPVDDAAVAALVARADRPGAGGAAWHRGDDRPPRGQPPNGGSGLRARADHVSPWRRVLTGPSWWRGCERGDLNGSTTHSPEPITTVNRDLSEIPNGNSVLKMSPSRSRRVRAVAGPVRRLWRPASVGVVVGAARLLLGGCGGVWRLGTP